MFQHMHTYVHTTTHGRTGESEIRSAGVETLFQNADHMIFIVVVLNEDFRSDWIAGPSGLIKLSNLISDSPGGWSVYV